MRLCVGIFGLALLAAAPARAAETIAEVPLDAPAELGTRIEGDAAAIKVTTAWPTLVNLAEVAPPLVDDATLVFEASVRSEGLVGRAYLEMWCHFDSGAYFGRGLDSTVTGTSDWRRLRAVFHLKAGERPSKVTLNLVVDGRGTVWVDDARLVAERR